MTVQPKTGHLTPLTPIYPSHEEEPKTEQHCLSPRQVTDVTRAVFDEHTSFGRGAVSSDRVVRKFLKYFQDHPTFPHRPIEHASILPHNDPTLLFVNSGMAPLKDYFLGRATPPAPLLCNVQPCVRTNDIDDIGDRHHLSLFHMMGSWSIGNYYKKEAIPLAYELLVNWFKFPKEKIFATFFSGDQELGLESDEESANAWVTAGLPRDHVVPLPKEDNLWGPAGETGPCGPCTEVFYDTGDAFAPPYIPGRPETFDTKKRYIEIWNAGVFMQLYKHASGQFTPLELKSVDTGSGLERMTMTLNGHESVYDTDLLKPIVEEVEKFFSGTELPQKSLRILTDHIRTAAFILSAHVAPANTGRGYIPRKLIRRFTTEARKVNPTRTDFRPLVQFVVNCLSSQHPHVKEREAFIIDTFMKESESLCKIIEKGTKHVEKALKTVNKDRMMPPQEAHRLVSSLGIPLDVLVTLLEEKNVKIDQEAYQKVVEQHREISRNPHALPKQEAV